MASFFIGVNLNKVKTENKYLLANLMDQDSLDYVNTLTGKKYGRISKEGRSDSTFKYFDKLMRNNRGVK